MGEGNAEVCLGASENILTCLTSCLAVLQVVFFFLYFSISAACKQCQSLICKSLHCQRSTCSADMLKKKKITKKHKVESLIWPADCTSSHSNWVSVKQINCSHVGSTVGAVVLPLILDKV